MSHERSETIEGPQGWENVYGHGTVDQGQPTPYMAGMPLPPMMPYERAWYPTAGEAEAAAARRSVDLQPVGLPSHMQMPPQSMTLQPSLDHLILQWLWSLMPPRGVQPGQP